MYEPSLDSGDNEAQRLSTQTAMPPRTLSHDADCVLEHLALLIGMVSKSL